MNEQPQEQVELGEEESTRYLVYLCAVGIVFVLAVYALACWKTGDWSSIIETCKTLLATLMGGAFAMARADRLRYRRK